MTPRRLAQAVLVATLVTFVCFVATAETGPEPVDFYCGSPVAAGSSHDPDTRQALIADGICGHFADWGFTAFGAYTFVSEVGGTLLAVWRVDFNNGEFVYTLR